MTKLRVFRHTIWSEEALAPRDAYREYRRLWLPLLDVVFILGGVAVVDTPAPALSELLNRTAGFYGLALALVAAVTLLGAAFPRLWYVEVCGKVGILFLMTALATASIFQGRPFGACLAAAASIPVLFRLSRLGAERHQRKENDTNGGA